ncbi:HAD-IB family hydrolase [Microbacterium sp. 2C]|uniref:HAD family hydrolase n=1 Tax=Microbacterium paulum TaxID=2707006 RepID=UPI0018C2C52A|nr:HAD family phosphatase [Microbacterium paulum]MBG0716542.1 HAD-IB family hydrolase [Microbacterium paulum]
MIRLVATEPTETGSAAFFDVDETLIDMKSMQSFLDYYFEDQARGLPTPWQRFQRTVAGLPREEGNRAYYRLWSGQKLSDLTRAGRAWFEQHIQCPGFLIPAALDAVREHRRAGRLVFLVSGSFHPCLDPLASFLDASEVFCTELVEEGGVLTGEIVRSRIGEGKRLVVEEAAARYGLRPDQTWGYGDHISDLSMLTAVGHAVVVGSDPQLIRIAHEKRWPTIAADERTETEGHK